MKSIVKIEDFSDVIDIKELMKVKGGIGEHASGQNLLASNATKCYGVVAMNLCTSGSMGINICPGGNATTLPLCPGGGAVTCTAPGSGVITKP